MVAGIYSVEYDLDLKGELFGMKKIIAVLLTMIIVVSSLTGCGSSENGETDDVYNLTFTVSSAASTAYAAALDKWVEELKEESNGRLNITIYYGGTIAGPTDTVEVTAQGGADMCWSTVPLNASKFNLINIFATYGEKIDNSLSATDALVKLYKENNDIKNEFNNLGLHICAIHALTPNTLGSKGQKFETLQDFNGTSVMAISTTNVAVLESLKAAPLGISTNDLYENFSKNVSKAAIVDASLYESTSAFEQIDYMMTYNWATCVCFVGMNQSKYDSLPDDLKQLIDGKFDDLSYDAGEKVNSNFQKFVKTLQDSGVETYEISDEVKSTVEDELKTVVEGNWNTYCEDNNIDAQAIKDSIDKNLADAASKYGEEYAWFQK